MSRSGRYLFNTFICVLVVAHAAYWYLTGRLDGAPNVRVALWVAQLVLGCIGVVTVSGVPQREDHAIVADGIAAFLDKDIDACRLPD